MARQKIQNFGYVASLTSAQTSSLSLKYVTRSLDNFFEDTLEPLCLSSIKPGNTIHFFMCCQECDSGKLMSELLNIDSSFL